MYLEGLLEDPTVPYNEEEGAQGLPAGAQGPTIRTNVDAGTDVIDLAQMRADLEAGRRASAAERGGGP
jgi:hypothetical protein